MKIFPPKPSTSTLFLFALIFLFGNVWACQVQSPKEAPVVLEESGLKKLVLQETPIQENPIPKDSIESALVGLMEKYHVPGLSLALLKDGKINGLHSFGLLQKGGVEKINAETMFSVGSISKVVNAMLTLKLVKEGKLKLDEDINQYLTKWKVESSAFTKDHPVSLRKILSHTAGFTVHGFADYLPEEKLPTTLEILNGEGPAKNNKVYVNLPVGSQFKYSGGGITVVQMIIEELTGLSYEEAARQILFEPLGLKRTTFENPLPADFGNIAKAHNGSGKPVALPRGYQSMPEKAASGLWTTPSDLAKILEALIASTHENEANLLSPELVEDMVSNEAFSKFGLGPKLELKEGNLTVYHNGANDSYRAHFKVSWKDKSGYIIMTNGAKGLDLIKELKPLLNQLMLEYWGN